MGTFTWKNVPRHRGKIIRFPFLLGGLRVCACACSMCIRHHTARSVPELRKLCVSPILPQVSTLPGITHVSLSRRRVSVAIKVSRIVTSMRYTARGTPPAVFVRGRGISRGGGNLVSFFYVFF